MAIKSKRKSVYGIGNPISGIFPDPIVAKRNPLTIDSGEKGQPFINELTDAVFILTSKSDNSNIWKNLSGGDGTYTSLTVSESFYADMSGTTTSNFVVETGLADDGAVTFDTTTNAGGITLTSDGNTSIDSGSGTAAGAAITINAKIGVATLTGLTTAAGATEDLTITNDQLTEGCGILVTVSNLGTNDAQMTLTRVLTAAGTMLIQVENLGAAALNGNLIVSWMILF